MRYVIAGSSGFLGRALRADLVRDGHHVTRLVRRGPGSPDESRWDPARGEVDRRVLAASDVVVNLAGASIGRPWTRAHRIALRASRVTTTRTLAEALAGLDDPPAFVSQSGAHFYGRDRGDEPLDEESPSGAGFLAGVVRDWEDATQPAEKSGVRVVRLRTGVVFDRSGGQFPLMALPFRFGVGGRMGSGRQYMPAVSLRDWLAAVRFLVEQADVRGACNVTLPNPPTNAEFTSALGAVLHRPTVVSVPAPAIRLLGEMSDLLLGSLRVRPTRLLAAGFTFADGEVTRLVTTALGRA